MLPSIEQFRSEFQRCSRRVGWTVSLSIGVMFLVLILSIWAQQSAFATANLGEVYSKFLPVVFFVVGLPLMLFGFWKADQHYKQFATLSCPHCSKSLVQSAKIVIGSRNCPYCGRQVVRAPEDPA